MASALLEEPNTVATEVKRSQIEDAGGSLCAALVAEKGYQGEEIGTLLVGAGVRGEGGGGEVTRRGSRGGRGVEQ